MKKSQTPSRFFGLHAQIPRPWRALLGALPFAVAVCAYLGASMIYLHAEPNGKLLPSITQMFDAMWQLATVPNKRTGEYVFWLDMKTSLFRLFSGIILSAFAGLFIGLRMAFFPLMRALWLPFVTVFSNVPIIATIVFLMMVFGVGDAFKIALIFFGTFFIITRDVYRAASAIPKEQVTKALTLGASTFEVVYKIMLPQVMPHLLSAVRLVLGAAWIYLISSEMIVATEGLGYRIAVMRRYLNMQVIIPYVLIIAMLAYLIDTGIRLWIKHGYPWFNPDK